jgi:ABC-2 type transport system permease protein
MRAVMLVATREFTERVRSRAFLVSNGAIMLLLVLSFVLPMLIQSDEPTTVGHLGGSSEQVAGLAVSQQQAFDLEIEVVGYEDRAAAAAALEAGDVEVVLLDEATVLTSANLSPQLEALLSNAANAYTIDARLGEAGLDPAERTALFVIEPLTVEQLDDAAGGIDMFDPAIGVVFMAVFLLYGLLVVYGQWVAQGIVEEKQSRVVEVLLSSVRPTQLLTGKILGLGALGLAQVLLLAGIGVGGLLVTDVVEVPSAAWGALALVVPWYVLGFLLYAALFAMAGSVISRVEDLQSAVMPVIVVLVLAVFGAQFALSDPSSTVASVAGVLPLTAPIVQPLLFAVGTASLWEVLLAIVLAMTTICLVVPLAARIYRGGVLRTRGKVSYREAWGSAPGRVRREDVPSSSDALDEARAADDAPKVPLHPR